MSEFVISTEFLTDLDFALPKEYKARAVVLKPKKTKDIYNSNIMGATSLNFVKKSLVNMQIDEIEVEDNANIIDCITPYAKDCDIIVVLYADTPLITQTIIKDAIDYATTKNLDYCKLPRGAIVKCESILKGFEWTGEASFLNPADFFAVFDSKTLATAREIVKKNIIETHLKNGVNILDINNCYIEENVTIGKNVTISFGNVIKNGSYIEENVFLGENNVIDASTVGKNCSVTGSFLKNAKIKQNSTLFCENILENKK